MNNENKQNISTEPALPCAIVKDLLPSYVDGLASEETAKAVKRHLEGCGECRKAYDSMSLKEPVKSKKDAVKQAKKDPAVQYLSKVKRRQRVIIFSVVAALLAFAFIINYAMNAIIFQFPEKYVEIENVCQLENGDIYFEMHTTGFVANLSVISFATDYVDDNGEKIPLIKLDDPPFYRTQDDIDEADFNICFGYSLRARTTASKRYEKIVYHFVIETQGENTINLTDGSSPPFAITSESIVSIFSLDKSAIWISGWNEKPDSRIHIWSRGDDIPKASADIEKMAAENNSRPFWKALYTA